MAGLTPRPWDDATVRARLTEAVARDGWQSTARRLGLRHVQYLRQILTGGPISAKFRDALQREGA